MPELPEVETTRRGIEPHIVGRRVQALHVRQPSLRWPIPDEMARYFEGESIVALSRRGKYLIITLAGGSALVHLGMSGSLRICSLNEAPKKHDHWDMQFEEHILRYHDPRRFGAFLWAGDNPMQHKLLAKLGPEPDQEAFNAANLYLASRGKTLAIKNFLMDSQRVVGVGNIYANEALFRAGIYPNTPAGKLSRSRYERLVSSVKEVLAQAIASGGSTLKDYVNGSGSPGYFQQELLAYGRTGEACVQCAEPVREMRIGQRSSFYCGKCQKP